GGVKAETEERGPRVCEHIEQRQRQLPRGDRWGRDAFPGKRSCATLLHRRLLSDGCGDHRPTGRRKEPPLLFQPVSSTAAGTFPAPSARRPPRCGSPISRSPAPLVHSLYEIESSILPPILSEGGCSSSIPTPPCSAWPTTTATA